MADAPLITPGRRTISRVPTAPIDQRREGRIDHADHKNKVFRGGTIGEVVDQLNHEFGKIPDEEYWVTE